MTRAKMLFSDEWLRRKIATGSDDEPAAGNPNGDLLGRERKHRGDGWWCASTTCPDLPGVIPCVLWLADIAPAICKATKRDSERRKEDRGVSAHWNLPDRRLAQLDRRQP